MKIKLIPMKSEVGMTLIYVTLVVALVLIIMAPLLKFVYTGHQSVRTREERMQELYASDAGIEDAMYQIKKNVEGVADLDYGNETYYPGTPDDWNDRNMNVTVEKIWIPEDRGVAEPDADTDYSDELKMVGLYTFIELAAAEDDFESGDWSGYGEGMSDDWHNDWAHTGSASIGSGTSAYRGNHYLSFDDSDGTAKRETNLINFYEPRLQFWARAGNLEDDDTVECLISDEETPAIEDWTSVMTWNNGNYTDTYEFIDIDLSAHGDYGDYGNTSHLWVRFDADLYIPALDDFESGGWSGGSGWYQDWNHQGGEAYYTEVTEYNDPHQGNYHLRLRVDGEAQRRITSISGYSSPQLNFWAKVTDNWDEADGDHAELKVRSDLVGWTTISTWDYNDADTTYHEYDIDLSPYVSGATNWLDLMFVCSTNSTYEHFYVDDVKVFDNDRVYSSDVDDHFYIDDLWIGNDVNTYTIEIAYTADIGNTWMDSLGVWMPPGLHYDGVFNVQGIPESEREPDSIATSFAEGTILEWNFNPRIDLSQPTGVLPIVRSLSFRFTGANEDQGMFTWLTAYNSESGGSADADFISWDTGYEIYKATSQASHEIWGSNTEVEAYIGQGEINKRGLASYGNYVATGSPLLIHWIEDAYVREHAVDPTDPGTWRYDAGNDVWYKGRATISDETGNGIPQDAEVLAAWLYWSAFIEQDEWEYIYNEEPDENVEFMYPMVYGPETFEAFGGDGDNFYTTSAYTNNSEPVVNLPRKPALHLNPARYCAEILDDTYSGGNATLFTDHWPILELPEVYVHLEAYGYLTGGDDYTVDYDIGRITIINDSLPGGELSVDYSTAGISELVEGTDYTVTDATGLVTITNDCLEGNVTMRYWAEHWESIVHDARDKYGTALDPVSQQNSTNGWSYACFADVTSLVKGDTFYDYTIASGNGEYAVRAIDATTGDEAAYDSGQNWPQWCYSGWSLIVLYESFTETAHQFYLYDPIHNSGDCPFYVDNEEGAEFTLSDFYPPEGSVEGTLTYFIGEGDDLYNDDYIQFKGVSQPAFENPTIDNTLSGPNNPWNDVINGISTTGEVGVDVDTFDIVEDVGSDTEANVRFKNKYDSWNLTYVILSFKTSMMPKEDFLFNVSAVTYKYELGTNK